MAKEWTSVHSLNSAIDVQTKRERSICPPRRRGWGGKKASPGAGALEMDSCRLFQVEQVCGPYELVVWRKGILRTVVPGESRVDQIGHHAEEWSNNNNRQSKHAKQHSNVVLMKRFNSVQCLRCHHYCGWLLKGSMGELLRSHTRSRMLPSESKSLTVINHNSEFVDFFKIPPVDSFTPMS